jgi:repressor LexA
MDDNLKRLQILRRFYFKHKRLPSYQEMLLLFKIRSKNAVFRIINKLISRGLLRKDEKGHLIASELLYGVKILGNVEAGFPSAAEEELVDAISLDDYLITNKQASFILKVSGTSMINAGIRPGDLVIVERGRQAKDNDIVVASVDNEWTIKRLRKKRQQIILLPENPKFKPIYPKNDLVLGGVVTGVIRKYH